MAKRAQQESGEGRVTAKSRPIMNLTARMPSVVSSSTSSKPGRTSYGYQDPGKSVVSDDRSEKPEKPSQPGYSKEDYGQSWSSQEWKSGAAEHDRSRHEKTSWDILQKVAPHREEPLLDGNAHSVRYGETITADGELGSDFEAPLDVKLAWLRGARSSKSSSRAPRSYQGVEASTFRMAKRPEVTGQFEVEKANTNAQTITFLAFRQLSRTQGFTIRYPFTSCGGSSRVAW